MGDTKTSTITANNTAVSIAGYLANASRQKNLVEQTSAGTRSLASFVPASATDANGDNFANTVWLPAGTYTIGAAGSPGDLFVTNDAGGFEPITNITVRIAGNDG